MYKSSGNPETASRYSPGTTFGREKRPSARGETLGGEGNPVCNDVNVTDELRTSGIGSDALIRLPSSCSPALKTRRVLRTNSRTLGTRIRVTAENVSAET